MQHSDDRPPASGRPSLLSAEQQGEADRQRILSGLETKPSLTTAGAHKARNGAIKWAAAGAAVLALTAGAGAWLVSEGEKEIVLAGTAPLPATPAPAAPLASEPMATPPLAREEISTAAILQDTPVIADKPGAAPTGAKPAEELKSLLEKGLPAVAKPAAAPPLVLADAPPYAGKPAPAKVPAKPVKTAAPAKAVTPAKAATPKPAARAPAAADEAQASNVQPRIAAKATKKTVAKTDPKAKKKPAPAKADDREESEVALLAALVAHSKATQARPVNNNAAALKKCKTLGSAADAEQCRTKLCSGSAKNEPECKAARAAKPASDS